jgi:hypothetical protein
VPEAHVTGNDTEVIEAGSNPNLPSVVEGPMTGWDGAAEVLKMHLMVLTLIID